MTAQKEKKADQAGTLLTADDLIRGGDQPSIPLEIPEISQDGVPGIVYILRVSAGVVLDFADAIQADDTSKNAAVIEMISKVVVDKNGTLLFGGEEGIERIRRVPVQIFNRLAEAVTNMADTSPDSDNDNDNEDGDGSEGNESSGESGSALPTD